MDNSRKWFSMIRTQSKVTEKAPDWYDSIEDEYIKAMKQKEALETRIRDLRDQLLDSMNDERIKRINTKRTQVFVIHEYKGRRVNSRELKKKYKNIFFECSNPYIMPEHLNITIKKNN